MATLEATAWEAIDTGAEAETTLAEATLTDTALAGTAEDFSTALDGTTSGTLDGAAELTTAGAELAGSLITAEDGSGTAEETSGMVEETSGAAEEITSGRADEDSAGAAEEGSGVGSGAAEDGSGVGSGAADDWTGGTITSPQVMS